MKSTNLVRDKISSAAVGLALGSTVAFSSAFADDTEVFFAQGTSNSTTHPNVLFVLDTSGSMNYYDSGETGSRLDRLKSAMHTILDETTNVNVGLMRFNGWNGGGSVIHPVVPIDSTICEGGACGSVGFAAKVNSSAADAEEILSSEAVDLTGNVITIGQSDPAVTGSEHAVGLHFDDLGIPQGATITSAILEFRSAGDNHSIAAFQIGAEQVDSATIFEEDDKNLSDRDLGTLVNWNPSGWLDDDDYTSNDISTVVQEVVDRSEWCGGNHMNIVITGTGKRDVRSLDDWQTTAPTLRLEYNTDDLQAGEGCMRYPAISAVSSGTDDAVQLTNYGYMSTAAFLMPHYNSWGNNISLLAGVRFADLNIPQGAEIDSAYLEFTAEQDLSDPVTFSIRGQAIGDAPTFDNNSMWNISNRTLTGEAEPWVNPPGVGIGGTVTTPDVADVLQEIISRPDWESGNAAAFVISGSGSGRRVFRAYDYYPNTPSKLKVIYKHTVSSEEGVQVTARNELKSIINDMVGHDGTPITEAYYEASLYMTGGNVDYGKDRGGDTSDHWWAKPEYQRVSHPNSYVYGTVHRDSDCSDKKLNDPKCAGEYISGSAQYVSPMTTECQSNHIVFLTDGQPSSTYAQSKVQSLMGGSTTCDTSHGNGEICGRELAAWLSSTDHNATLPKTQSISTYTIGFNYSGDYLRDLARAGEGQYFNAESASDLVQVFKDILGDVLTDDTAFVAPGATVNQFNRLTHRDDIYFALFKPDSRPSWNGNLKRYRVGKSGDKIAILDKNDDVAVDPSTGFFKEDSESWWSGKDGSDVSKGGAAMQLDFDSSNQRRVFTYLGDNDAISSSGVELDVTANKLHEDNNNITLADLGIEGVPGTASEKAQFREDLLKWSRGIDVKDDDGDDDESDYRQFMGDPMHARPVIVNYADGQDAAGNDKSLSTIFVGTNEGYLHAIEREEGKELYAFMPKELIQNITPYYENNASTTHPYGLDGALSVWSNDTNNNVMIDANELALLYTGMRRGGRNYYALDIADREDPKLAWVIEGGINGTLGFEELGQTWARAVPNKIMYNGAELDVLIFSAGYDVNQDPSDNTMSQTPDSMGRGFFIVDAETGDLIYSVLGSNTGTASGAAGIYEPDMEYSVPGDIRALDTNNDGLTDQLYFGDMGGHIWRWDFVQHHQAGDGALLEGGIIADLSSSNEKHHRRFYYEPDVAVIAYEGERFLSISIGSGWRAHPLNKKVEDRFYVLRSDAVLGKPAGYGKLNSASGQYSPITEADLIDVTNDIDADAGPYGWFMDLPETGEKVLGNSVTVNNQVVFSSYKPISSANLCDPNIGSGNAYVLNILNGSPRVDMDEDGDVDEDDRSTELSHGGIPPEPAVLITEHGPTVLIGPEQPVEPDFKNLTQRTNWFKPGDDSAHELVTDSGQ